MKAERKEDDNGYSYTLELGGNSGTSYIKKPITEQLLATKEADVDRILTDVLEHLTRGMNVHLAQKGDGWELTSEPAETGDEGEEAKAPAPRDA